MHEIEEISMTANRIHKKLPLVRDDTHKYDRIFFEELECLLDRLANLTNLINLKGEQNNA
jgi:hypothetical protein